MQSIKEEERKKNKTTDVVNSNPQDELTIYLRQPYGDSQTAGSRRFSKLKKGADEEKITDKIEIDSDNIETPPATRKLFSPPKEVKPVEKEPCKRERCSSSFQSRDFKNPMSKNVNNTDFGIGKWCKAFSASNLVTVVVIADPFQAILIVTRRQGEHEDTKRIKTRQRKTRNKSRWSMPSRWK